MSQEPPQLSNGSDPLPRQAGVRLSLMSQEPRVAGVRFSKENAIPAVFFFPGVPRGVGPVLGDPVLLSGGMIVECPDLCSWPFKASP